jgi:hypothetical protein
MKKMLTINFEGQKILARTENEKNTKVFLKKQRKIRRTVLVRLRDDLHEKIRKIAQDQDTTISRTLDMICDASTLLNNK